MHAACLILISECDKNLSLLREAWMEAKPDKKSRWLDLINQALDERIRLMAMRDSKAAA